VIEKPEKGEKRWQSA